MGFNGAKLLTFHGAERMIRAVFRSKSRQVSASGLRHGIESLSANHGGQKTNQMNLYVSNLSYNLTDNELREAFERFGAVTHARIILDRETGRSRGFAFVEMPNDDEARAAINGLNSTELSGRPLKVVEARPREERPYTPRPGGAAGGGAGGGGGGYK